MSTGRKRNSSSEARRESAQWERVRSGGKDSGQFRGYSGTLAGEDGDLAHSTVGGGQKLMESKIFKETLDSFRTL